MPVSATIEITDKTSRLDKWGKGFHKAVKQSSGNLKKLFTKMLDYTYVKSKTKPPKVPLDVVHRATFLLPVLDSFGDNIYLKHFEKIQDLDFLIHEIKILYDNNDLGGNTPLTL